MLENRCPSQVFWIPVLVLASVGILFLAGGCGSPSEAQLTRVPTHCEPSAEFGQEGPLV
jgi:hypothetical protein